MGICVRQAQQGDLARVEEIENAADAELIEFLSAGEWLQAPTGAERADSPGFILVSAESVHGPAVGFAHITEVAGFAHLEQLSVVPKWGRRGHGRMLVKAAKLEARERGHRRMSLRTFASVPWNAPFYASCGFVGSEPATEFHRRLVREEFELGISQLGQRIEMTAVL